MTYQVHEKAEGKKHIASTSPRADNHTRGRHTSVNSTDKSELSKRLDGIVHFILIDINS